MNNKAIELLQDVLLCTFNEEEQDKEIYEYLKQEGSVPEDFIPYWEGEDDLIESDED
jgi:hypothetical protein